jgi:Notch-like protein
MPQGTKECIQLINNYQCSCKPGFQGRYCETKTNFCQHNPCQNGGVCNNDQASHQCFCPNGYYGSNCQFSGQSCDSSPCQHGGTCQDGGPKGYTCDCPPGTTGPQCEQDTRNECTYNPCKEGFCIDKTGDYDCSCHFGWRGKNCDIKDAESKGGIDPAVFGGTLQSFDPYLERQKCVENSCAAKKSDNRCDEECNTHFCDYDGGDCRIGLNPWKLCTVTTKSGKSCWDVFKDGYCDEDCNTKECLFDGRDCDSSVMECNPMYDVFCSDHFNNGQCDERCNTAPCGWDGLDCEASSKKNEIIPGSFYIVLTMSINNFNAEMQKRFERYLSLVLRTNFKIKRDEKGEPMVHEFDPSAIEGSDYAFNTNLMRHGNLGIVVYLEIDNIKCLEETGEHCFDSAAGYANLMGAMIGAEKLSSDPWGIVQVGAGGDHDQGESGFNSTGLIIGITIIALIVVALGVITQSKKRKAKGVTWFPEGFSLGGSGPKGPDVGHNGSGQEMFGVGSKYPSTLDMNYPHDGWSDDDPTEHHQQPAKKRGRMEFSSSGQTIVTEYDDNDSRQWTQQHLNAADIRNPDIIGALTPPQGDASKSDLINDVDVRGPMGMTPLMIASFRGGGLDTGEMENLECELDDSSPAVIQDLISQGADLSTQMDKTGESPLHLAARYARADAAKKLLEAGSDANAQDNTGRSPLHAAVAADAQGVFHILLKNRATNLNAKTCDGTTPLILAARLAIEGMVEQLIEADADINLADEYGKTALHWAAAVNNVEAVNVLLANGANRDAQDTKDETPLFLAAKEGSYQACRALLDHCANRDIQDHMDRLPIHIANEKMHQDIVTLLEEHIPPAPQMTPAAMHHQQQMHQQLMGSPQNHLVHSPPSGGTGAKPKAKRRTQRSEQDMLGSETLPKSGGGKKPSMRRKKLDSTSLDHQSLSPEMLSMLVPD